jgi:hypothetical protein
MQVVSGGRQMAAGGYTAGTAQPAGAAANQSQPYTDQQLQAALDRNSAVMEMLLQNGVRGYFKKYGTNDPDSLQKGIKDIERFNSLINA